MGKNTFTFSNETYTENSVHYGELWQKYRKIVVLKLIGSNKKVLDVGCFDGSYMKEFEMLDNDVYGIDASSEGVKVAQSSSMKAYHANLEEPWPFENNYFDTVFLGEVIEHIVDTDFLLDEILRVLKSDGEVLLTTPNMASFSKRLLLLFGKNPYQEASFTFPKHAAGHLREFTPDLLKNFFEYKSFTQISFKSDIVSLPGVPEQAQRLLGIVFPSFGRSLIAKFKVSKKLHN